MADVYLKTGWLLGNDNEELLVYSHVQIVRYNADMTLKQYLDTLDASIVSIRNDLMNGNVGFILTKDKIITALGYVPVDPNIDVNFLQTVTIGGMRFQPLGNNSGFVMI